MDIRYNEIEKSIEIKDELYTHYLLLKVVMLLNLISSTIFLFNNYTTEIGFRNVLFFVIIIISIVALYIFFFKKSTSDNIPIQNIIKLNHKTMFGKQHFFLLLSNGKKRDLNMVKTQDHIIELKKMFSEIGIAH